MRLIVVNSAEDAQATLDRLKAGADFAVLAREQSVDPTSTEGGFLGKIDPTSLRDELRDGLRAVQPGQLSKIVKLPSGYAILQVLTEAQAADLGKADRALQAEISAEGSIRLAPLVGGQDEAMSRLVPSHHAGGLEPGPACRLRRLPPVTFNAHEEADALVDPRTKRAR